jgi:serine/threonine protein phosphatase PrpC
MFEKVRSLFGSGPVDTRELSDARNLVVRGFAESHPGMTREVNEDRVALHLLGSSLLASNLREPDRREPAQADRATLAVVADGMGGSRGGEVASELAIQLIPRLFFESTAGVALALEQAIQTAGR